jgi:Cu2+-exporting ATPase
VCWELKPEEKAKTVQALREQGQRVAFLGDGVNDAPALISADVGIGMPQAADLAREAAQVLLLREDLQGLVAAMAIARHTRRVLRRCAQASIGINSATMALAVAGVLPPVVAASLHNGSTIGILSYAALDGRKDWSSTPLASAAAALAPLSAGVATAPPRAEADDADIT